MSSSYDDAFLEDGIRLRFKLKKEEEKEEKEKKEEKKEKEEDDKIERQSGMRRSRERDYIKQKKKK